ncbi:MAG: DUF2490 domain-containing protein [Tannerellaceae bacterium]|jgi:hypothetical protein|nr:DUF2490 domain-containing protein [Tannerellaceae bacterium]
MTRNINIRTLLLALASLLAACPTVKAQTPDFGIWASAEVEKKLSPKWSLNGELELRTHNHSREIGRWGLKLGGDFGIVRNLKLGAAYQFLYFHDTEYSDYQPRHRLMAYAQGRQRWGNFSFTLRERIQVTTKDETDRIKKSGKTDTYKLNPEWSWRNRLKMAYDIPRCRFTPSLSVEAFYLLNHPDGNRFDCIRTIASLAWRLDRKSVVDFSVIYNREINRQNPQDKLVAGINYAYSF